jgi:hypothetical protein
MGHAWEETSHAVVDATVDEVWDAIATGPGIDGWFMGHTEVVPGPDGAVNTDLGGFVMRSKISVWEPGRRLAFRGDGPGERFIAYDYLIEARAGGATSLRVVASGFLPQDDWEAEFDALGKGGRMYFETILAYAAHFAGRRASVVNVSGPPIDDWASAWPVLRAALGLGDTAAVGDKVHVEPGHGLPTVDGVVDFVNPAALGIRTDDALYRFVQGFFGSWFIGHHLFGGDDEAQASAGWQAWVNGLGV